MMKLYFLGCFLFLSSLHIVAQDKTPLKIWYNQPANARAIDVKDGWQSDAEWLKALPVGNGFLGAMVFGDVNYERLQLNEKSLWSGSPDDSNNPDAWKSLGTIRKLLFEGKYKEAEELTQKTQICKGPGSGQGNGMNVPFGCFQTLGDLYLDFDRSSGFKNYYRELDLNKGVITVSYEQDGVGYKREVLASNPDRALIVRLTANKKGALSFKGMLTRSERSSTKAERDNLLMSGILNDGKGGNGMLYAVRLKAVNEGGKVTYSDKFVEVQGADAVTLILTASTDYKQEYPLFKGADPLITSVEQLNKVASKSFQALRQTHVQDYSSLFSRVSLQLAKNQNDEIPTDVRLKNQSQNGDDLYLQQLYFQYGRYLLISSSRKGSLPSNLQGMWANKIQTPWNCDYHTDINVQMNYWPAGVTNLSECNEPLIELIKSLVKPGEKTAAVQYKLPGWCVHPITNIWGFTSPGEHSGWGMHVSAGGWLGQHLWEHYAFTRDTGYLAGVYPVMLEAAEFYLGWLVKDPATGELVSGPATSPENAFIAPDGSVAQISMGPSHDQEVIAELFTNVLKASQVLSDSNPLLQRISSALNSLAKPKIGSDGRLMEWREEFKEKEPTHRHASHMYMLHPGNQISLTKTPELASAARKSLDARTDIGTGWAIAWKINLWARLGDGNRAYLLLKKLLSPTDNYKINMSDAGGTYPNLFCGHPPFQIDGNFGGTAGIAEMLLQSHGDYVELLPALPDVWRNGEVKGLVARGNIVVDMKWKDNVLTEVRAKSAHSKPFILKYRDKILKVENVKKGRVYKFSNL